MFAADGGWFARAYARYSSPESGSGADVVEPACDQRALDRAFRGSGAAVVGDVDDNLGVALGIGDFGVPAVASRFALGLQVELSGLQIACLDRFDELGLGISSRISRVSSNASASSGSDLIRFWTPQ